MTYIFSYFDDVKIKSWNDALCERYGNCYRIIGSGWSPIFFPFDLIRMIGCHGRPRAVLFRYLNDSPFFLKSFVRMSSEVAVLLLCTVLSIEVYWVIHNVDRESTEYFPSMTKVRRSLLNRVAVRVLATHSYLCQKAASRLDRDRSLLKVASFGNQRDHLVMSDSTRRALEEIPKDKLVGLWIGEIAPKKILGLRYIIDILQRDPTNRFFFVVAGAAEADFDSCLQEMSLEELDSIKAKLLFLGRRVVLPSSAWPVIAHFVVKPLSDASIPLTYCYAAYQNLPFVGPTGVITTLIATEDGVGFAFDPQLDDITDFEERLSALDLRGFAEFRERNSWLQGARNIFDL